jgi:hypothetical protein
MTDDDTDSRVSLPELRDEELAGLPRDGHLRYRRIGAMIRDLAELPSKPSEIWQRRVLAALEAQRREHARRIRNWIIACGLAVALVTLFVIRLKSRPLAALEPFVVAQIVPSGDPHLGDSAPGIAYRNDKLVLRAMAAGPAEIRVYDERGMLAGRCGRAPAPGCTSTGDGARREYRLELTLRQLGLLRIVLVIGDHIQPPAGDMDQDLEAARDLRVLTIAPIKVL